MTATDSLGVTGSVNFTDTIGLLMSYAVTTATPTLRWYNSDRYIHDDRKQCYPGPLHVQQTRLHNR